MSTRSPAWTAGYRVGYDSYEAAILRQIVVPEEHREPPGDFISGYLIGSRDARDAEIMDGIGGWA